jgi:crotonobetainyl-CoA:carnitine CoA-transferase CaiB-like acyl-CoA transferase
MSGPLSSLKMLDFSTLLPGPYATMMLADMGADILWVDAVKGDIDKEDTRAVFMREYLGRSKRSIALDLKRPEAITIVKRLVNEYDIIVEQFRPGVMERLGLDYHSIVSVNPIIIYCSITGYGQTGPYKDRAGHDINYLATAGVSSHSGRKKNGPILSGIQIADVAGGSLHAVSGILAAVIQRIQTGEGQYIDISMTDGSFALNSIHGAEYLSGGSEPKLESTILNGGSYYDYYETKDGRYFSVGSLEPKFFLQLLQVMKKYGNVEIDPDSQLNNQKDIKSQLSKTFKKKNYDDWCTTFSEIDACVEPVLTFSEAAQHSQLNARKMIVDVPADNGIYKKQIGNPLKFSLSETDYRHIGVPPGAHSKEILLEIGFTESELKILFDQGIVS